MGWIMKRKIENKPPVYYITEDIWTTSAEEARVFDNGLEALVEAVRIGGNNHCINLNPPGKV